MSERLRKPALVPVPVRPATARDSDPSAQLEVHYRQIWETRMRDSSFANPQLEVAAIGFVRHEGDWLGVMITPWFLNLFLISGGGALWGDIPAGERRYLDLPCGTLQFVADDDPDLGPHQYCQLIAPVTALPDMAAARQAARDALEAVFAPIPGSSPEPEPVPKPTIETRQHVSRRGFLGRLAGRR